MRNLFCITKHINTQRKVVSFSTPLETYSGTYGSERQHLASSRGREGRNIPDKQASVRLLNHGDLTWSTVWNNIWRMTFTRWPGYYRMHTFQWYKVQGVLISKMLFTMLKVFLRHSSAYWWWNCQDSQRTNHWLFINFYIYLYYDRFQWI